MRRCFVRHCFCVPCHQYLLGWFAVLVIIIFGTCHIHAVYAQVSPGQPLGRKAVGARQAKSQTKTVAALQNKNSEVPILRYTGFVDIVRLNALNSPYLEGNPCVSPDGSYVFFFSERGGQPWSLRRERSGYEGFDADLWYSERLPDGSWKSAEPLDANVNTQRGEDEPFVSFDSHEVVFQSWRDGWQTDGGPYYTARYQGVTWGKPRGLGGGINEFFRTLRAKDSTYATDGSTFSTDMKTFVVACGVRYEAPMDLYVSRKNEQGEWSYPRPIVFSVLDKLSGGQADISLSNERTVFLAADGVTLYFATDAFKGFGGLDIYKATLNNDATLSNIVNIGEPFNTKGDDYGFTLTATGDEAIFVRNGDLYSARLGKAMDKLKPTPMAILTGTVKHKETRALIGADITFRELPKGTVQRVAANSLTGEYGIVLALNKRYEQVVTAPGFAPYRRQFVVKSTNTGNSVRIEYDVYLSPSAVK
jgi:hypothetical protein